MSQVQKSGIGFALVGVVLILAKLVGIAQGQQYVIGGAFLLAGAVMYLAGSRRA